MLVIIGTFPGGKAFVLNANQAHRKEPPTSEPEVLIYTVPYCHTAKY